LNYIDYCLELYDLTANFEPNNYNEIIETRSNKLRVKHYL